MRANAESKSVSVRGRRGIVKITGVAMKTNRTCKYLYDNLLLFISHFFLNLSLISPQRLRVLPSVFVVHTTHCVVDTFPP